MSGAYLSTRGRYLSKSEVDALPLNPSMANKPLFLHIQGNKEQDVKGL